MSDPNPQSETGQRPRLDERAEYIPRARVERFIVRGLAECIPTILREHAAPRSAPARALDVGCGRQPFRRALEQQGFAYTGLDTQQNADGSTAFVAAIDERLPDGLVALAPFDFILCTEVLEHVADWPAAWTNMTGLLRPGGRMLITCPHLYPLHEEPYDFWRPTPHALRWFAARHGLSVIQQRQLGSGWDVVGTVAMAVSPRAAKGSVNPLAHILAALVRVRRKLIFWAASQQWLRRLVNIETKLYLSNVIVLEKPA